MNGEALSHADFSVICSVCENGRSSSDAGQQSESVPLVSPVCMHPDLQR